MPKVVEKSRSEKIKDCRQFVYNSETGEVLGRTGSSWAKVGLFYLFYYAGLAGFFAICLAVFFQTMDERSPTQKSMQSPLKQNPGMGFRPFIKVESTLIQFDVGDSESYDKYVKNLDEFLDAYRSTAGDNVVDCSGSEGGRQTDDSTVCRFPLESLGDRCTKENWYGYPEGKPCVLLKMNRIYGWTPVPLDNETIDSNHPLGDRFDAEYIGVTCDGEVDADDDSIRNVTYFPDKGFPASFYPYLNQPNYLPPVVMAQFDVKPGQLHMIWCRVWAKNIKHHRVDLQGSVHFELIVDRKQ